MSTALGQTVRDTAKSLIRSAAVARLQTRSLGVARAGIKTLEAHLAPLSAAQRAEISDYARDNFGGKPYVPWLELYTLTNGEFRSGWIPDNYYHCIAAAHVNGDYHQIAHHRGANGLTFDNAPFPDLGYWVNGLFYDRDYQAIPPGDVAAHLSRLAEDVVFRTDGSGPNQRPNFVKAADVTPEMLAGLGNSVCQRRVNAHPDFDRFGLTSLAILRIGTAVDGSGHPGVRSCYLGLGRTDAAQAGNPLRVAVDWHSGKTASQAFLADWMPVTRHPDTDADVVNLSLTAVSACCDAVLALHRQNPLPRLICWDVAVDTDGQVSVLQWQGGSVAFAEATQGPCFADLGWDRYHME